MAAHNQLTAHDALPEGTKLGEFEIQKVVGVGGFGVVYRAYDHALQRIVALKEYLPGALAGRGEGYNVSIRSTSHAETFGIGLRSFVNEARLLAQFDHPALLKVYRFWEDNGTAYMVMPFYEGVTLHNTRRAMTRPPAEAWMRSILEPIFGALEVMHRENVFHRDIAPDNIILRPDGAPVLLDFGAARKVIGDRTQTLTAIVKPNFAPIEQYSETTQLKQGPWTDLYALSAVVYYCATGRPPIPSSARALHDEVIPLTELVRKGDVAWSERFAHVWQSAMAVKPSERPQSVQALRAMLDGTMIPPTIPVPPPPSADSLLPTVAVPAGQAPGARTGMAAPPPTGMPQATVPTTVPVRRTGFRRPGARHSAPSGFNSGYSTGERPARRSSGSRALALGLVVAAFVVFGVAAWWQFARSPSTGPSTLAIPSGGSTAPAAPPSAVATVATPLPAAASVPVVAVPAPEVVTTATTATPATQTTPATPTPTPATVVAPQVPADGGNNNAAAGTTKPAVAAAGNAGTQRPAVRTPRPDGNTRAVSAGGRPEVPVLVLPPLPGTTVETTQRPAPPADNTVVAKPPAAPVQTPRQACGSRMLVALHRCMQRQCTRPELAEHPECVEWRRLEERSGPR